MKRTIQKLPESELDIMLVLWKQKSDMSRITCPVLETIIPKGGMFYVHDLPFYSP